MTDAGPDPDKGGGCNVRETDTVGRWGGEEFILLLPETGLEAAATACEKIRGIMARSSVCYQDCQIMVTATFGVSRTRLTEESKKPSGMRMRLCTGASRPAGTGW